MCIRDRFKLKGDDQRERLSTVLHTLAQAVSDINTLISPFLPHAANRVHAVLGGDGELMPMPRLEVVPDLDDDARSYPIITGEYTSTPRWESRPVVVGTPMAKPTGVFVKLDPEQVIEDERARLGDSGPGGTRHHTDPLAAPKMGKPKGGAAAAAAGARADEAPTA